MAENDNAVSVKLVSDAAAHEQFEKAFGNEAKRQTVLNEFRAGRFTDRSHIDFFLEQYSRGDILLSSPEDNARMAQLLDGIDGYESFKTRAESHGEKLLRNATVYETQAALGAETMTNNVNSVKTTDFGLGDALKDIEKKDARSELDTLLTEARRAAVERQYTGKINKDLRQQLAQRAAETKWYQFKRRRQLDKASRDIDPESYWSIKKANGNAVSGLYYDLRGKLASRKRKNVVNLQAKLEKVTELQAVDASTKWMSVRFWDKVKVKSQLMFRRSPEKLSQKLLKNANISDLESYIGTLDEQLGKLPQNAGTRLEQQGIDTRRKAVEEIKSACALYKNTLAQNREGTLAGLHDRAVRQSPKKQQFINRLDNIAARMNREVSDRLADDPAYKAAMKFHNGQLPENLRVEQAVTKDALMDEVLKAKGITNQEEISRIKAEFHIEPPAKKKEAEKTAAENESPANENPVNETPANEQNAGSKNIGNRELENAVRTELASYNAAEDTQRHEGDTTLLNIAEDKSRYDLITKNKDGQSREPTESEIKAMAAQLAADGIKDIVLEDGFSAETQQAFLKALDEQKISVANREEVDKRLAETNKAEEKAMESPVRESTERPLPEENPAQTQPARDSSPTEAGSGTETPVSAAEKQNKMDIKQVLISAVSNSKTQEEQMAKLEMIEKIQSGNFATSGEAYVEFVRGINNTFGKETPEAVFLGSMAAAKGLEQDMKKENSQSVNADWLKEEKNAAHIDNRHADKAVKVSTVISLADKYKGKPIDELKQDEAYRLLPGYAKQGTENLFRLEQAKDVKPEQKTTLRNQILGQVIQGKNQPQRVTKEVKARSVDLTLAASRSGNSGK